MNKLINLINTNIDISSFMLKNLKNELENYKIGNYVLMKKVLKDNYDKLKEELESTIKYYEDEIKMYGTIKKIILEYFNKIS